LEESYLAPVYYKYDDLVKPFPPLVPSVPLDQVQTVQESVEEDVDQEETVDEEQEETFEEQEDTIARVHADLDRLVRKHFGPRCVVDRTSGRVSCPPRAIKSHAVPTRSTVVRASRGHGSSLMGWKRPSMVASRVAFP
jgi:hypothetical protein